MNISTITRRKIKTTVGMSIISAAAILLPTTASASLLQSGVATIDLDPAAWSTLSAQTVRAVFDKADMDTMSSADMLLVPLGSPSTTGIMFEMYTDNAPTGLAGRGAVNTTFDYNGTDATTSTGVIGLAGAWKTTSALFTGQLVYGDYSLEYDASRVGSAAGGTSSGWMFVNHVSFAANTFDLANATLVNDSDGFSLSGDLVLANSAAFLGGFQGQDVGDFNIVVSSVPVPAAAWLFASGLVGMIGLSRKK